MKPLITNAVHVMDVMPKLATWSGAMEESLTLDIYNQIQTAKGALNAATQLCVNVPECMAKQHRLTVVEFICKIKVAIQEGVDSTSADASDIIDFLALLSETSL